MREDRGGWIFPSPHKDSGTGHRARMDRAFRDAVTAAGLDPATVTPHVMRHTAITALVQAGVDLPTVKKISGHNTLAMVMRYSHVHGSHIDRAIKTIGRTFPELSANQTGSTATQELHTSRKRRST
jgi:site-specific recombinase XerD